MVRTMRLVLLALWGAGALAVLVVFLSSANNLIRRIGSDGGSVSQAHASCGDYGDCDVPELDMSDRTSLQRGAALYMHNCVGCHALSYARHERIAEDLKIPVDIYKEHLLFADQAISGHVEIGMPAEQAADWFGVPPPDLTLVARARQPEWIYTYLRAFYVSEDHPWGYDNLVFPSVAMPNVLEPLQGIQRLGCVKVTQTGPTGGVLRDPISGEDTLFDKCGELILDEGTGRLNKLEFDEAASDLTAFLVYTAEPFAQDRKRIGLFVMLYLIVLATFTYLLQREFNKDYK